jgi:hypothetical protein
VLEQKERAFGTRNLNSITAPIKAANLLFLLILPFFSFPDHTGFLPEGFVF